MRFLLRKAFAALCALLFYSLTLPALAQSSSDTSSFVLTDLWATNLQELKEAAQRLGQDNVLLAEQNKKYDEEIKGLDDMAQGLALQVQGRELQRQQQQNAQARKKDDLPELLRTVARQRGSEKNLLQRKEFLDIQTVRESERQKELDQTIARLQEAIAQNEQRSMEHQRRQQEASEAFAGPYSSFEKFLGAAQGRSEDLARSLEKADRMLMDLGQRMADLDQESERSSTSLREAQNAVLRVESQKTQASDEITRDNDEQRKLIDALAASLAALQDEQKGLKAALAEQKREMLDPSADPLAAVLQQVKNDNRFLASEVSRLTQTFLRLGREKEDMEKALRREQQR